jgi:SAM-dependent methyltransferase
MKKYVSPKRNPRCTRERAGWFQYYAGYSPAFVKQVVTQLLKDGCENALDPWNGAGTTTEVAKELNLQASGIDANPVMVIAAKARLLGSEVNASLRSLSADIIKNEMTTNSKVDLRDDPLLQWFSPDAARPIRALEQSVQRILITTDGIVDHGSAEELGSISSLAAFFYVALFRTVRVLLKPFRTSNPTWLSVPETRTRLRTSRIAFEDLFAATVSSMVNERSGAGMQKVSGSKSTAAINLRLADSCNLPFHGDSFDAVLSSPPYCTRLDYAVATRAELAVLKIGAEQFDKLRRSLIGTSTVAKLAPVPTLEWGGACNRLLAAIRHHSSKDSSGYYLKHHLQYFDALYRSFSEIDRVLRPGGTVVLVVQDSFYKDVHNNLSLIVQEMGYGLGWSLTQRQDYKATRALGSINRGAIAYGKRDATESVLWLKSVH